VSDRSPTNSTAAAPPRRRPSLLRHRDFVNLWSAETISQFGTQITLLAIPLVAAQILKVEPFEFGLLTTIEFLPFILVSLPAGVWVDRLPRRPILIVGDVGRAIALASIPIAFYFNVLTIWQLYVVGFVTGCLTVFFDVAYQAYLPSLVDREDLVEGNSKLEASRSAAQIAGPGTAGLLIGLVTAPIAIVIDTLSFLASALFIFRIRTTEPPPAHSSTPEGAKGPGMRREVAEGLRYVLGNRYLRAIAACTGSSNFFSNVFFAILILYLVRELGLSAEQLGIAFSVGAFGFLAGALVSDRISKRIGVGPSIIVSSFVAGVAWLPFVFAPPEFALVSIASSMGVSSFAIAVYNITQVSFRQAITPQRMQGRMNATMRFIVWGTIPLGATLSGFLGGTIGLRETILVGVIGSLFPFLPVLFSPVRTLREMPEPEDERPSDTQEVERIGDALDETPGPTVKSPDPSRS
jgi:MFS family permease